jgi:hypothetical protein
MSSRFRVKSTDPRKRVILAAFRMIMEKQGVTVSKITDVFEYDNGAYFAATLLAYQPIPGKAHGKYRNLGRCQIDHRDFFEAKLREDEEGKWMDEVKS